MKQTARSPPQHTHTHHHTQHRCLRTPRCGTWSPYPPLPPHTTQLLTQHRCLRTPRCGTWSPSPAAARCGATTTTCCPWPCGAASSSGMDKQKQGRRVGVCWGGGGWMDRAGDRWRWRFGGPTYIRCSDLLINPINQSPDQLPPAGRPTGRSSCGASTPWPSTAPSPPRGSPSRCVHI